jgi:hypothetical protein
VTGGARGAAGEPPPFDGYAERACRVSATSLVRFDRNRYSVECRYVGRVVTIRAYAERLVVVCAGAVIAEHPRLFARNQVIYNPWHYVEALARKPGALRNGAPFKDWNLPAPMTRPARAARQIRRWRPPVR